MANLNCPHCGEWIAVVDDVAWRVQDKARGVVIEETSLTSNDLWSQIDVLERRADEWLDRGVYDPLPPPPDPVNSAVTLRCACGEAMRFERP